MIDLDSIRSGLRNKALLTISAIAADSDATAADVESAMLTLGASFDSELNKARKRLLLANRRTELVPLMATRNTKSSAADKVSVAKESLATHHRDEMDKMEIKWNDALAECRAAQAVCNKCETAIMALVAEIGDVS